MSDEVPAQVIVDELFKSRPMVGKTTPMDCWSINVMSRADASALKTMINRPVGRMLVWSWKAGSGLAISAGGLFQVFTPGPAPVVWPLQGTDAQRPLCYVFERIEGTQVNEADFWGYLLWRR